MVFWVVWGMSIAAFWIWLVEQLPLKEYRLFWRKVYHDHSGAGCDNIVLTPVDRTTYTSRSLAEAAATELGWSRQGRCVVVGSRWFLMEDETGE